MQRSPLALLDHPGDAVAAERDACRAHFARSLTSAVAQNEPYRHWMLQDVLPADMAAAMDALPFPAPALNGLSGSREIHNNTRRYIDAEAIANHKRRNKHHKLNLALWLSLTRMHGMSSLSTTI